MNTGHNHHQGDFHTDDIQDAEFQDAEIIDETHEQEVPKSHHQATAQDSLDVEIEDETKDDEGYGISSSHVVCDVYWNVFV